MRSSAIEGIVQTIEQVPTLPIISSKIQRLLAEDDVTVKQIGQIIEKDPPLAARIIRIVNSPFFGMLDNIGSIERALAILGLRETKNIVLGFAIRNFFLDTDNSFDRKRFWKHAIVCSQIAKYLGQHFRIEDNGTFFLSGLIHDIGKIFVDQYLHEDFKAVVDCMTAKGSTFSAAEKEILGTWAGDGGCAGNAGLCDRRVASGVCHRPHS